MPAGRSELTRSGEGSPRFFMLETVREFALEQLTAQDEADAVREWHADYFLALAEGSETRLRGGAEQRLWLERLDLEHQNMRAALTWCRLYGEAERGLRLAAALSPYWNLRGHVSEARSWLEGALAVPGADAPSNLAALRQTSRNTSLMTSSATASLPTSRSTNLKTRV